MSMQSITTWTFDLKEPLELARRFADIEGTALLYSGGSLDSAQSSYLCLFPEKKISVKAEKGCWATLKAMLGDFDAKASSIPRWVGYIGYEMGCFADPDKHIAHGLAQIPDSCFYAPSVVIHFSHSEQKATLYAHTHAINLERTPQNECDEQPLQVASLSDTLETYLEKIAQAKDWILDGEIYQVNLSQEILLAGKRSSFKLFERLAALNPAPFSAYVNCHPFSIVSTSPERFLCKKDTFVETRPIKGTAPRGQNREEDQHNYEQLLRSEKERAELLMITDLMRSDIGKIALPGSVQTKEIVRCEAYANVFHLLSVVNGRVQQHLHPIDLIQQLFPGGSITGCPKLRAMEAIFALENRPRGIYTGSIGYIAENGDFDFNIAIRTLIVHPETIQLQLGGAIVIDSDPHKEYKETLHKGRSLFSILEIMEALDGHSVF